MSESKSGQWQWENAAAGAIAGFATVAAMHPLDVVRTRFQGALLFVFTKRLIAWNYFIFFFVDFDSL